MSDSEITAKFGADTSGFDRALRSVRGGLGQFGGEGELHFNKVAKAGHEFKHLLGDLSEQVTGLGAAFKFAISPMAGVLALAGAGFAALKSKIDSTNESSNRLEKGTADPIFRIKDAMEAAKKSLEEFDEQFQHWAKTHNQVTPADKLTQNLKEQLSMMEKRVALAEKLSQKDKDALELQKLRATHGLQGRALQTLAGQIGTDDAAVQAAAAENKRLLGRTAITSAESNIKADEEIISKLDEQIAAKKGALGSQGGVVLDALKGLAGFGPSSGAALAQQRVDEIESLQKQKQAAQNRQRQNRAAIDREQAARRAAANRLSEAQAQLGNTRGAFNSMSESIEQTREALSLIPGGFAPSIQDSSIQRTADWMAAINSKQADWNKAHGMGSDLVSFSSLTHKNDEAGNSIATLNDMFKRIMTDAGMKVTMTIEDN